MVTWALRVLRPAGFGARLQEGARRVRKAILVHDEVIVFIDARARRSGPLSDSEATIATIAIRRGSAEDVLSLSTTFGGDFNDRWSERARKRLESGDRLFIARSDDKVMHVAWVGVRDNIDVSYELPCRCVIPLPAIAPVVYDCWTPEAYRGLGIYPKVLQHLADRELSDAPNVYIYALTSNRASCQGIIKAGFIPWRIARGGRFLGRFTWNNLRTSKDGASLFGRWPISRSSRTVPVEPPDLPARDAVETTASHIAS